MFSQSGIYRKLSIKGNYTMKHFSNFEYLKNTPVLFCSSTIYCMLCSAKKETAAQQSTKQATMATTSETTK